MDDRPPRRTGAGGLRRLARAAVFSAAVVAALFVLETLRPPSFTLMWRALFDAGHAPLFGVIALGLLGLSLTVLRGHRARHYGLSFALTSLAALGTEALQFRGPRDADVADVVRGVAGGAAFLLLVASLDRTLLAPSPRPHRLAVGLRVAGLLILVGTAVPLLQLRGAYRARDTAFPRLCDFDAPWERRFVRPFFSSLERESVPSELRPRDAGPAGRVTFYPGRRSGILFRELAPDWSAYDVLEIDVYSPLDAPVTLLLRIDDIEHRRAGSDRHDWPLEIAPGPNHVVLPLGGAGGFAEQLDRSRMCHMILFAARVPEPFSLYFDRFRLARADT